MARCTSAEWSWTGGSRVAGHGNGNSRRYSSYSTCQCGSSWRSVIGALEEEAFDFVGGIQGVAALLKLGLGKALENASDVAGIRRSVFVDDLAEHQHLAGSKDVGGAQ